MRCWLILREAKKKNNNNNNTQKKHCEIPFDMMCCYFVKQGFFPPARGLWRELILKTTFFLLDPLKRSRKKKKNYELYHHMIYIYNIYIIIVYR